MRETLKNAVENESEFELMKCLDFSQNGKIDADQYELIERAPVGPWHSQHEGLVNTIDLENLRDDLFADHILEIVLNNEVFRWYDDELESTLKKCVHALKTIDSEKANRTLKILTDLNNANVRSALEMYK